MNWPTFDESHFRFRQDRPSKFCVVTAYQDSEKWRRLGNISSATMISYCREKGYGFRAYKSGWDATRPHSWSKLLFVRDALRTYEWVFWMDADAAITNPKISLSSFITGDEKMVVCRVRHLNETRRDEILNCGVFLLKAGDFSERLLETLWNKEEFINHPWWEQQAFIDLYGSREEIRNQVKVVPGRSFNSVCPWRTHVGESFRWSPGDFVVHISAYPVESRIGLMRRLISWAKEGDVFHITVNDLFQRVFPNLGQRWKGAVSGIDPGLMFPMSSPWKGMVFMVDPWKQIPNYRDLRNFSDVEQEKGYQAAYQIWGNNPGVVLCRKDSWDVANELENESLDWVFIDGPHRFDLVEKNLKAWWPKVRIGGVLCGHDFFQDPNHPSACFEVKEAVIRFAAANFLCHRYTESMAMPSWSITKTGLPVSEPTVLDRNGLIALFDHRRYKFGVVVADQEFFDLLAGWKGKCSISGDSVGFAREFERHSLDWVFLNMREVRKEMESWWDKVRPGGMICGSLSENWEVREEVEEFLVERGLLSTVTLKKELPAWFVEKPLGEWS